MNTAFEPDRFTDIPFLTPLTALPNETIPKPHVESTNKDTPAIYKEPKLSFVSNLYIASLTVVGLFIVFRFVQRSR